MQHGLIEWRLAAWSWQRVTATVLVAVLTTEARQREVLWLEIAPGFQRENCLLSTSDGGLCLTGK